MFAWKGQIIFSSPKKFVKAKVADEREYILDNKETYHEETSTRDNGKIGFHN